MGGTFSLIQPAEWTSTTKATYLCPDKQVNPLFRNSNKNELTTKMSTKTSGYQQNRAYWDGQGWKPDPILTAQNIGSEYRDRFNADLPFHRNVHSSKVPQLAKKEYNYKYN